VPDGTPQTETRPSVSMKGGPPGHRQARVRRTGFLACEVLRTKPDGSMDWATLHLTKKGARVAAFKYERKGEIRGWRP
jgi:hypothetical protein